MKILIAGAGVAGLAIGWRLAQAGASVDVFERGRAGRGATWAAAGMLSPGGETGSGDTVFVRFARASREAWPAFAAELEEASGCTIGYREEGSLLVAMNDRHADELQARAHALRAGGTAAEWLSAVDACQREPLLSPQLGGALYVSGDAQADNRALGDALSRAFTRAGGRLREGCELRSVILEKDRVRGAITQEGPIEADAIILAMGAWLNRVAGIEPDRLPPVGPAKGQMIALEPPAGTRLPGPPLWGDGVYLVSRAGRLLAGATVEEAGFDTSVTAAARDHLFTAACAVIPAAKAWRVVEIWAGLRPRTPDGLPVLGETSIAGLFVASGQFRNGILFAPLVAEILRQAVLSSGISRDFTAFDPKRFGT